jgi:threonylcarbamoyladenosine tRNA methylthiotransferase MtaB
MFDASLRLIDDCGLTFLHVFPFSPRPGTPAARMPQVARAAIKQRAARLREKGDRMLARHLESRIGSEVELLMEREHLGRTPGFVELELGRPAKPGELLRARVTASDGKRLRGERLAPKLAL